MMRNTSGPTSVVDERDGCVAVVGIREAGDAAPPVHVRSDAIVRRRESIPHEHLPGIIFVVRAVDGAAGVREHASIRNRDLASGV